jgi:16S rRNA processing protein RimM
VPPSGRPPAGHVLLGEFGRAHGLAGEVRLKSYTEDPLAIGRYGPLAGSDGRAFRLTSLRQAAGDQPDLLVVRVEGVASREAAEALNRIRLHVARERLGETADEDEFFLADLVGLAVDGPTGPLGTVVGVPNYGGGELLEIAPLGGGRTTLLPFTRQFVPEIDIPAGRIRVEPPEVPEGEAEGEDGPESSAG